MTGGSELSKLERLAATVIPNVLVVAAFSVSFSHVRQIALDNGASEQWKSWAVAGSVELLALSSALEIRRRRAHGERARWSWAVLLVGIGVTVAANERTATPGPWGVAVAIWPAVAYLLAASLKATRGTGLPVVPALTGPVPGIGDHSPAEDPHSAAETAVNGALETLVPNGPGPVPGHLVPVPDGAEPDTLPVPSDVLEAAHRAAERLANEGTDLSRRSLQAQMRDDGHPIGTARATALLPVLRMRAMTASGTTPETGPVPVSANGTGALR